MQGISSWDVSKVTTCVSMFYNTAVKSIDLTGWNSNKLSNINYMFSDCKSLEVIRLSNMNITSLTNSSSVFTRCSALQYVDLSGWTNASKANILLTSLPSGGTVNIVKSDIDVSLPSGWTLRKPDILGIFVTNVSGSIFNFNVGYTTSEVNNGDGTYTVTVTATDPTKLPASLTMSSGTKNSIVEIKYLNTSNFTLTSGLFNTCGNLLKVDARYWDTRKLASMSTMFYNCPSLKSIEGINTWDVSKVTNCSSFLALCTSIKEVDLSSWDMPSMVTTGALFSGCKALETVDISSWNTSTVTDMSYMFKSCESLVSIKGVEYLDTQNVKTVAGIFETCSKLKELRLFWNTRSCTDFSRMFSGCPFKSIDISSLNLSSAENVNYMFYNCLKLKSIIGIETLDISHLKSMNCMFASCKSLTSLDLSRWDTKSVQSMVGVFNNCSSLLSVKIESWDVSNVVDLADLFSGCSSITELDLSSWDTSKLTKLNGTFYNCYSLKSIDVSTWNTKNVVSMFNLFRACNKLTSVDLRNWDTSSCNDFTNVFYACNSVTEIRIPKFEVHDSVTFGVAFPSYLEKIDLSGCSKATLSKIVEALPAKNATSKSFYFAKESISNTKNWECVTVGHTKARVESTVPLCSVGSYKDRLYWDVSKNHYCVEKNTYYKKFDSITLTGGQYSDGYFHGWGDLYIPGGINSNATVKINHRNKHITNLSFFNRGDKTEMNLTLEGCSTLEEANILLQEGMPLEVIIPIESVIIDLSNSAEKQQLSTYEGKTKVVTTSDIRPSLTSLDFKKSYTGTLALNTDLNYYLQFDAKGLVDYDICGVVGSLGTHNATKYSTVCVPFKGRSTKREFSFSSGKAQIANVMLLNKTPKTPIPYFKTVNSLGDSSGGVLYSNVSIPDYTGKILTDFNLELGNFNIATQSFTSSGGMYNKNPIRVAPGETLYLYNSINQPVEVIWFTIDMKYLSHREVGVNVTNIVVPEDAYYLHYVVDESIPNALVIGTHPITKEPSFESKFIEVGDSLKYLTDVYHDKYVYDTNNTYVVERRVGRTVITKDSFTIATVGSTPKGYMDIKHKPAIAPLVGGECQLNNLGLCNQKYSVLALMNFEFCCITSQSEIFVRLSEERVSHYTNIQNFLDQNPIEVFYPKALSVEEASKERRDCQLPLHLNQYNMIKMGRECQPNITCSSTYEFLYPVKSNTSYRISFNCDLSQPHSDLKVVFGDKEVIIPKSSVKQTTKIDVLTSNVNSSCWYLEGVGVVSNVSVLENVTTSIDNTFTGIQHSFPDNTFNLEANNVSFPTLRSLGDKKDRLYVDKKGHVLIHKRVKRVTSQDTVGLYQYVDKTQLNSYYLGVNVNGQVILDLMCNQRPVTTVSESFRPGDYSLSDYVAYFKLPQGIQTVDEAKVWFDTDVELYTLIDEVIDTGVRVNGSYIIDYTSNGVTFNSNIAPKAEVKLVNGGGVSPLVLPRQLLKVNSLQDKLYWDYTKGHYCVDSCLSHAVISSLAGISAAITDKGNSVFIYLRGAVSFDKDLWNTSDIKALGYTNTDWHTVESSDLNYKAISFQFSNSASSYGPLIYLSIPKSELTSVDLEGLDAYLNTKPLNLVYRNTTNEVTIDYPDFNQPMSIEVIKPRSIVQYGSLNPTSLKVSRINRRVVIPNLEPGDYTIEFLVDNPQGTIELELGGNSVSAQAQSVMRVVMHLDTVSSNYLTLYDEPNVDLIIRDLMVFDSESDVSLDYFEGTENSGFLENGVYNYEVCVYSEKRDLINIDDINSI